LSAAQRLPEKAIKTRKATEKEAKKVSFRLVFMAFPLKTYSVVWMKNVASHGQIWDKGRLTAGPFVSFVPDNLKMARFDPEHKPGWLLRR
jgi:hypothetical protein